MKEKIGKAIMRFVGHATLVVIFAGALAFFSYNSLGTAVADTLRGFTTITNNSGSGVLAENSGNNATSTVSALRYVANGATTTLPTASSTARTNQDGINIADAESITFSYLTVGSTSPYTARFDIEYGYDIPLGTNPNVTSIHWFRRNLPVLGPTMGYAGIASTSNLQDSHLATSSAPAIIRSDLGTATTSEVFEIPTLNAKYMRINAAAYGSAAMFHLNVHIRNYK